MATLHVASDVYKPYSLYVGDCSLENHDAGLFVCCLCRYVSLWGAGGDAFCCLFNFSHCPMIRDSGVALPI